MATRENKKTSIQMALRGEFYTLDRDLELQTRLKKLFTTLEGDERTKAVIESIQRHAVERFDFAFDSDFDEIDTNSLESIRRVIQEKLTDLISNFITDAHRETIVRYHARGHSTAEAVWTLMREDSTMNRLAQSDAIGAEPLKDILIPRFAYLKPGTTRWPEKKYGAVWRETREQHIHEIKNTPFSSPEERIALLAKNAERVHHALNNNQHSVESLQVLTQALTKTVESLEKLSPVEQQTSANSSTPQLIGILERITVVLKTLQQPTHNSDANALAAILEKAAIAMQPSPEQKAITGETEDDVEARGEHRPASSPTIKTDG